MPPAAIQDTELCLLAPHNHRGQQEENEEKADTTTSGVHSLLFSLLALKMSHM